MKNIFRRRFHDPGRSQFHVQVSRKSGRALLAESRRRQSGCDARRERACLRTMRASWIGFIPERSCSKAGIRVPL